MKLAMAWPTSLLAALDEVVDVDAAADVDDELPADELPEPPELPVAPICARACATACSRPPPGGGGGGRLPSASRLPRLVDAVPLLLAAAS